MTVKHVVSSRPVFITMMALIIIVGMTTLALSVQQAHAIESSSGKLSTIKIQDSQLTTEPFAEGDYKWMVYLDDKGEEGTSVWITEYTGSDTQVIVPTQVTYNGKKYPPIPGVEITSDNGNGAFQGNTKIEKVAFPDGVLMVGDATFSGCTSLTEVAIGKDCTYFGANVFTGCSSLKTYYLGCDGELFGEGLSVSGIGQDSDGNIYSGVTVYAKKDSPVWKEIEKINEASKNGNKITLVDDNDPYSKNTVKPSESSGGSSSSSSASSSSSSSASSSSSNSASSSSSSSSSKPASSSSSASKPASSSSSSSASKPASSSSSSSKPASSSASSAAKKPATAYSPGATETAMNAAIIKHAKESDPKGSTYSLLKANITKVTNKSLTLKWSKAKGAKKYIIYGNKCGPKNKMVKLATIKKANVTGKTFKKVNKKKVKKGTYYKFIVVALDKNNKVVSTSKTVHAATTGGKVGNDKKVTTAAKKNKVSLKKKKTFKLKAKEVPASKKLKVKRHRKVAYESTNTGIAKVNSKGIITGVKEGICYIFAYAQNGISAKIKVTVA